MLKAYKSKQGTKSDIKAIGFSVCLECQPRVYTAQSKRDSLPYPIQIRKANEDRKEFRPGHVQGSAD